MTQAPEAEPIQLAIVACETCDQLFLESPRRQTCPGCGGAAGLRFFEYVADQAGLHLRNGVAPAIPEPAPAEPPPAEPPPTDPAPDASDEVRRVTTVTIDQQELLAMIASLVLSGDHPDAEEFREELLSRGVEPDDVAAAVGRLQAVALLIASVTGHPTGELVGVEEETVPAPETEPAGEPETDAPPA